MKEKHLHIVCLEIPWPVDYGGVVDLFYKIRALFLQGVKIHLHCFTHNRTPQAELEKYCETVNYYQRKDYTNSFSFSIPFIVKSRSNYELLVNLNKDDYPILLEGIHCTYHLSKGHLKNRKVIVRLHNTEYEYYQRLSETKTGYFKKLYYLNESRLLKKYEKFIAANSQLLAVSQQDVLLYQQELNAANIQYLPVFLPFTNVICKEGKGCYSLYHGNLSISENEAAVVWLMNNIFRKNSIPIVIAGKNPSRKLQKLISDFPHACLVANPSEQEMQDIINKAQVHILPSLNSTGIKLKLLNALFNGRHCLVNRACVQGTGLEPYCYLAQNAIEFTDKLEHLFKQPFTQTEIQQRQQLLQTEYNNVHNAEKLINIIW